MKISRFTVKRISPNHKTYFRLAIITSRISNRDGNELDVVTEYSCGSYWIKTFEGAIDGNNGPVLCVVGNSGEKLTDKLPKMPNNYTHWNWS